MEANMPNQPDVPNDRMRAGQVRFPKIVGTNPLTGSIQAPGPTQTRFGQGSAGVTVAGFGPDQPRNMRQAGHQQRLHAQE